MKKALSILIFLIAINLSFAQVLDDFSDADLNSNPAWNGDLSNFTVVAGQLQSAGNNATNQKLALSTANEFIDSTEWTFLIDLKFNPTSTNLARVYLVSSQQDLKSPLNGYYIQFGETNADSMDFYKQTGTTSTKLFTSKTNFASNIKAKIKVNRSSSGVWTFYIDANATGTYNLEGSVKDVTHAVTAFAGLYCEYATASRFNLYNFDDFKIIQIEKDTVKPTVSNLTVVKNNQLSLKFSEKVNKNDALNLLNYELRLSIGNPTKVSYGADSTSLILDFGTPLESGNEYEFKVSGISDLAGNIILTENIKISYFVPGDNSVIINEIMADPTPRVGLPEFEYIELYNISKFPINLTGWKLSKGTSDIALPSYNLLADSFLILTTTTAVSSFTTLGAAIGVVSFPSLTNTGDQIILKNENGKIINQVNYTDDWYQDVDKKDGGFSLELISPSQICRGKLNWKASENNRGGTPSKKNSVFSSVGDVTGPTPVEVQVENNTTLIVNFDEPVDSLIAKNPSNYQLNQSISIAEILKITNQSYKLIVSQLVDGITYEITVKGHQDCSGNIQNGDKAFSIGIGKKPQLHDVLITEIFADENPVIGLPEAEYIEIYNSTNQIIDLKGCTFTDGTSSVASFPAGAVLLPNEYAVVCSSTKLSLFKSFGKVFALSSFPSLNSTGDNLVLKNSENRVVHQVSYLDDWYADPNKNDGGYALEMINLALYCQGGLNWKACVHPEGGTPGSQNSVNSNLPDLTSPRILSTTLKKDTLFVVFDEPMDRISIEALTHYSLSQNLKVKSVFITDKLYNSSIGLVIDSVKSGVLYTVTLDSLRDCSGNLIKSNTTTNFGNGKFPDKYDIIITEIFADENPVVGLPEAEYIEIFNTTNHVIDLNGCSIGDGSNTSAKFSGSAFLLPQEYAIVCSSTKGELFTPFGKVFAIPSFPSLNSTGDLVYIKNSNKTIIHFINYLDSWYGDENKKDGGWSLEIVDKSNICGQETNWSASINPKGGTPGQKNSIEALNPDLIKPTINNVVAIDSITLEVTFSEILDSLSLISAAYTLNPSIDIILKQCEGPRFNTIKLTLNESLVPKVIYTVTTSNQRDCIGNIADLALSTFVLPEKGLNGDIIINEILFNPRVGGNDFVEIYNQSDRYINIKDWSLAKLKKDGTLESLKVISTQNNIIKPKTYKILTDNIVNIKQNYPKSVDSAFVEMTSLPGYTDDKDSVLLINNQSQVIDSFYYDQDYHHPLLDDVEGVSLEKINFNLPSNDKNSWHSAASIVGYATPGYLNSQSTNISGMRENIEIEPKIITPNGDGRKDFATIQYKFDKSGYAATIIIYDYKGREIKNIAKNELLGKEGVYIWDGTNSNGEKATIGYYVAVIEIFGLSGEQDKWSESIAIYGD